MLTKQALKQFTEWGRQGGLKGGPARSKKLSPERRKEIAIKASKAAAKARKVKRNAKA